MKNLEPMRSFSNFNFVQPEDRAIQGWNPSAEPDSKTAGQSGVFQPLWPGTAGSIPKRKIPGSLGDWSPKALLNQEQPEAKNYNKLNPAIASV